MSVGFGFSIGDIVLMSQLAYRLYAGVTSGRKSASKDLKELGDALFGLHCALDHLRQTVEVINARASSARLGRNAEQMRRNLDLMIDSCASTLNDLDDATKIYRDVEAGEALEQDEADSSVPISGSGSRRQRVIKRWRQQLKVQWNRVQWEFKGTSIDEYRQKLQAHTAAITIVLSTFIWSTTDRIEADGQNQKRALKDFQDQELSFNEELMATVQGIRNMLLASQVKHTTHSFRMESSPKGSFGSATSVPHARPLSLTAHGCSMLSAAERRDVTQASFVARMAVEEGEPLLEDVPRDIDELYPPYPSARPTDIHSPNDSPQLPQDVRAINEQRQLVGSREFQKFQAKYQLRVQPSKPSFLKRTAHSIPDLREGIDFVFRPVYSSTNGMKLSSAEERKREVIKWIEALDSIVETAFPASETASSPSSGPHLSKPLDGQLHSSTANELVDLLATLNRALEQSEPVVRRNFYHASQLAHLDQVFDRLQRVSKSVRCRKEIEEFEDMREEWKAI